MGKFTPALLGGLFIGVLSSLPFVNFANCCCLWVLGGGVLVVYLQQQNLPTPVQTGEAAIGGLMAGAIGGIIFCVGQVVMFQAFGPAMFDEMRSEMAGQNMPPEAQAMMEKIFTGQGLALILFAFVLPVFALFGTLGSLLGLVFFRKKTPPQPPAQQPAQFG